jgi:hypothetical protein
MRRRQPWSVAIAILVPLVALAQDAGTSAAPKSAGGPPQRPKPNPVLVETFKDAVGTWSCTGSMESPQSPGTQFPTRSEMRLATEVEGFAYSGTFKGEPNKAMPTAMKGHIHWYWDDAKKTLAEVGFDNFGETWTGTSDGIKGDTTVWNEEGVMMGKAARTRTTITKKSPKEVIILSELEDKGAWRKMGEDRCKKK